MIRKVDRYVFREILAPTGLGLLLFTFVLLMNTFFLIAREVIEKDVGFLLLMRMVALEMPRLFRWTLPMAVLLGTLIGVGRMSAQSEVVALRAAGVSFGRLARAVMLLGVAATLLGLFLTQVAVPPAIYAARSLRDEIVRSRDVSRELRPRVFYAELPGTILYADEIRRDGTERILERVLLHIDRVDLLTPASPEEDPLRPLEETDRGRRALVLAASGRVENDRRTGEVMLTLGEVRQYLYQPSHPQALQDIPTESTFHRFPPPPAFLAFSGAPRRGLEDASLTELRQRRDQVRANISERGDTEFRRFRLRRVAFEVHARFAIPCASLAFALLAFALASVTRRGGRVSGFALSLLLILVYWALFSMSEDLGREGHLPPALAAWGTNGLLLGIALALLWARRTRGDRGLVSALADRLATWGEKKRQARATAAKARTVGQAARMVEEAGEVLSVSAQQRGWGASLIDRYLVSHFLKVLLYAGIFLLALYLVVEFTGMMEEILQDTVPWGLLARYFAFFTPNMIRFVLPVACLCSVLVTIAVLSRNGEIMAMKAGGLSLGRVSRPLLGTTLVICLLFFLSQEYIFPVTNRHAERIRDSIAGRPAVSEEEAGRRWVFGTARRLYGYRVYSPTRNRLDGVNVMDLSTSRLSLVRWIEAEQAQVARGQWLFQNGWIREFREGGETYEEFRQLVLPLEEGPELFGRREQLLTGTSRLPEQTAFLDLWTQIRDLRDAGYEVDELSVGLYEKIAYPLTPLVMVLLGLPFAFRIGPRGSLYGIGVALILVIAYWAVFALFQSWGREGELSPLLAAGAPNVLFALAGAYLFLTLRS